MDSRPIQTPPTPNPQPLPFTPSKSKLPIKRKTLHSSNVSSFNPSPNITSSHSTADRVPPLKFHRIWTEPDEIRFLQGLLDSASDGLVFPRDLNLFYHRFSTATCHPYTKAQLSDKLRRLRRKFRAVSSRLLRELNLAALSPHDRALYNLSKQLWSPEFASVSPFVGNSSQGSGDFSKIKVEGDAIGINCVDFSRDAVKIDDDGENWKMASGFDGGKIGGMASKIVLDLFDECLREAKKGLLLRGAIGADQKYSQNVENFGRRWQEQRALELNVFARRLSLVIEDSFHGH